MRALSKPAPETGASHQTGPGPLHRQSSAGDDTKRPITMPHARAVVTAVPTPQGRQHVLANQQPSLIDLTPIPSQPAMCDAEPVAFSQIPSDTALLAVANPLGLPQGMKSIHPQSETDAPQAVAPMSQTTPDGTNTLVKIATGVPDVAASAVSSGVPNAVQSLSPGVSPNPMQMVAPGPVPVSASIIDPIAVWRNAPNPEPDALPSALPVSVAQATQSLASNSTVPHAVPAVKTDPAPSLHPSVNAALPRGEAPVSPSPASTAAASPPPASDATASAVLTAPGSTTGELAVLIQSGSPSPTSTQVSSNSAAVAKPAGVLGANGTDVTGNAISNPIEGKQHPASQAQSQTGDASASPDQNQPVAAQQEQGSTPVQTSFANHIGTPMEHAPNGATGAPLQSSPPLPAHAKAQDNAPPAVLPSTPALPVINTARLIQNMGQSEMRVGMRSPEFGNISISTSATRDLVSAQISLEHSELARTLAVHLPEMQERLGNTHQAMNVRIDLNGQGTGTSAGISNSSADGSRGDRQQRNSAASTQATNGFGGRVNSVATVTAPTGDGKLNARLDITA